MSDLNHQWATFYKGRLRIKACSCCGQMSLPSNAKGVCEKGNIMLSPIVRAGYTLIKPKEAQVSRSRVA